MDQISLPELENILNSQSHLMTRMMPIFTGLKKMDYQTFQFIMKNFSKNEALNFEDLEEISSEQLAKLFEKTNADDPWQRVINFYSLKNIKGNRVIPIKMPLGDFDVNDLLPGLSGDEINIEKPASAELPLPPVEYKRVGIFFHVLNDMSNETADWLASLRGLINFGLEANLTAAVSERLTPFDGVMEVAGPDAVSLVEGLKNRKKNLDYVGHELTEDMAEALAKYQGEVAVRFLRNYSPALETLVKKTGKLSISVPKSSKLQREAFFRTLGQKKGYLHLPINIPDMDHISAKEMAFLKERDGDLELDAHLSDSKFSSKFLDSLTGFRSKLIIDIYALDPWGKEDFKKLADNNFWVTVQVLNAYPDLDPSLNTIAPNLRFEMMKIME